ncbi:MAG: S8 family peptidase [Rhodothermales bacterium]|nr:S8 family peptidase [Rhodothermales bacterium]
MRSSLLRLLSLACFAVFASGCVDSMLSPDSPPANRQEEASFEGKLRHPQLMDKLTSSYAGKGAAGETHVFVGFNEYEADGITRRVLDSYGITRRVLEEYGVTRRVMDSYGVTRRILEEYGVTRRVLDAYGITRRVLESYGVTGADLDQNDNIITDSFLADRGITAAQLEQQGVTRRVLDDYGVTRRVLQDYGVTDAAYDEALATFERSLRLKVRIDNAVPGMFISLGSLDLTTFLEEIASDTDISLVELDIPFQGPIVASLNDGPHSTELMPWGVDRSGFTGEAGTGVEVFVLDSGVYANDLNVAERKDFTSLFTNRNQTTWDDTAIQEQPFFDPRDSGNPNDESGHGTHVAGTIAALNNGTGVVGMAPNAEIHSLKVLTAQGQTDITTLMAALDYVIVQHQLRPSTPKVVNLSLGMDIGSTAYNILDEAVQKVIDNGITVVVSAGNAGMDAATVSPAHVTDAITVGAYDLKNDMSTFSNHGASVDINAPGELIVSLSNDPADVASGFAIVESGTSMAAPHVTGAAALFLTTHPQATPAQVKQSLLGAARNMVTNQPAGTTDRSLWVGPSEDGGTSIHDVTLPPFFQYAILSKGKIELQNGVDIFHDLDASLNANILAGDSLKFSNGMLARGFGYTGTGVSDKELGDRYFQPVYNPAGLHGTQLATPVEMPRFNVNDFREMADIKNDDPLGLQLVGSYDCGTREDPLIWYVLNDLQTDGRVTLNGYCIFIVGGNIQIQHNLTVVNDAAETSLALYAGGELQIEKNGLNLPAQIFASAVQVQGGNITFRGSLTVQGDLQFEGNINVAYRPANCILTEPFWPTGNCSTAPLPPSEPAPSDPAPSDAPAPSEPAPTDAPAPDAPAPTDAPAPDAPASTVYNVEDAFASNSFSGTDGTQDWASAWNELGESNGPGRGKVRVVSSTACQTGRCLKINAQKSNRGAYRVMNLTGATSATLSFDYKTAALGGAGMQVDVSSDGGATWVKLASFSANLRSSMSFDITDYKSAQTAVRFISRNDGDGNLFVDNVRIESDSFGYGGGY